MIYIHQQNLKSLSGNGKQHNTKWLPKKSRLAFEIKKCIAVMGQYHNFNFDMISCVVTISIRYWTVPRWPLAFLVIVLSYVYKLQLERIQCQDKARWKIIMIVFI